MKEMMQVYVPPKKVDNNLDLTKFLSFDPIDTTKSVDELLEVIKMAVKRLNQTKIFVAYFIGKAADEERLAHKYTGMTLDKLAAALGISTKTLQRYRKLARILTPQEVQDLSHIAYRYLVKLPQLQELYGEANIKQLKFRLITNDFEGVKSGGDKWNIALKEMADNALLLSNMVPEDEATKTPSLTDEVQAEVVDATITNPCETVEDNGEDDEGALAVDKILADRSKAAKAEIGDEHTRSKSETRHKAEVALAQSKRAAEKLNALLRKFAQEYRAAMDSIWEYETFVIADTEIDERFRELIDALADNANTGLEASLDLVNGLHRHGHGLRKVEMPEGATAASILDPKNGD